MTSNKNFGIYKKYIDTVLKNGGGVPNKSSKPIDTIEQYINSASKATKETIIRKIARVLNHVDDIDPTADISDIIKEISKLTLYHPDRQKLDKSDVTDGIIIEIANVINHEVPEELKIDTSSTPSEICVRIQRFISILFDGIKKEFSEYNTHVADLIKKCNVLDDILDELHASIMESPNDFYKKLYDAIKKQRDDFFKILSNALNVDLKNTKLIIQSTVKENTKLLNDISSNISKNMIDGKALLTNLYSLTKLAKVSDSVNTALNDIGLSIKEYKAKSMPELVDLLQTMKLDKANDTNILKLQRAIDILLENFYDKDIISSIINKTGGARLDDEKPKTEFEKRIDRSKKEKDMIVNEFYNEISKEYDNMMNSLTEIFKHIGDNIPIATKTFEAFRESLNKLEDVGTLYSSLAIVGLSDKASTDEHRNVTLSQFVNFKTNIEDIIEDKRFSACVSLFKNLLACIEKIIKKVEYYSSVSFGGNKTGGGVSVNLMKTAKIQLNILVQHINHKCFVEKIKQNLNVEKAKLGAYEKDYIKIMGDALSGKIIKLEEEEKNKIKKSIADGGIGPEPDIVAHKDIHKTWTIAKKLIKQEYSVKINFYKTIQAIELILKNFTKKAASNINEFADIRELFNNITIIADWYNNKTGDNIAKFFESFLRANSTKSEVFVSDDPAAHYYEKIKIQLDKGKGISASIPIMADGADDAVKHLKTALESFQALKNIINTFARLGEKIEPKETVFMSTTNIYNNLLDFLATSAISVGLKKDAAGTYVETYNGARKDLVEQLPTGSDNAHLKVYISSIDKRTMLGNWVEENKYFIIVMKAICSKIMTTLNIYQLMNKPETFSQMLQTRMLIGGGLSDIEIIPDATDLYFRLPRLVEFYSKILAFDITGPDCQISMIPDMDNIFGPIINYLLTRNAQNSGVYSVSETHQIIRYINSIYTFYRQKSKGDVCNIIYDDLIETINTKYGAVQKSNWIKYVQYYTELTSISGVNDDFSNNFAILPDEGVYSKKDTLAPSDIYSVEHEKKVRPGLYDLRDPDAINSTWRVVNKFRDKLNDLFNNINKDEYTKVSYKTLIKQSKEDIIKAATNEQKTNIALKLIQGTQSAIGVSTIQQYMFHELVIAPLNTLSAVYTLLAAFKHNVENLNLPKLHKGIAAFIATGNAMTKAALLNYLQNEHGFDQTIITRYILDGNANALKDKVLSVTTNETYADIYAMVAQLMVNPDDRDKTIKFANRYVIDNSAVMEALLLVIFQIKGTHKEKGVEVLFNSNTPHQLQLDFSSLKAYVNELFTSVKYNLNKFKNVMSKEFIDAFEKKTINGVDNKGSLFWLESKIIDELFIGRLTNMNTETDKVTTLSVLSKMLSDTYTLLLKKWDVVLVSNPGAGLAVRTEAENDIPQDMDRHKQIAYGDVITGLLFYNRKNPYNFEKVALTEYQLGEFILNKFDPSGAARTIVTPDGHPTTRFELYSQNKKIGENRGMMMVFNQLLATYLAIFCDNSTQKIYTSLIDSIVNSAIGQSVINPGWSHPDLTVVDNNIRFGVRADPTKKSILYTSLSKVIQRLTVDKNRDGSSLHIIQSINDVPDYMKNNYITNLPTIAKEFEMVIDMCQFIKNIVKKTDIFLERTTEVYVQGNANAGQVYPNTILMHDNVDTVEKLCVRYPVGSFETGATFSEKGFNNHVSEDTRKSIVDIADGIIDGSQSVVEAANKVMSETVTERLFGEIDMNYYKRYSDRNGCKPLTPISVCTAFLSNLKGIDERELTNGIHTTNDVSADYVCGVPSMGESAFKLIRSTNVIFDEKQTYQTMPSIEGVINEYNGVVSSSYHLDKDKVLTHIQQYFDVLRLISIIRMFKANICKSRNTFSGVSFVASKINADNNENKSIMLDEKTTYAIKNPVEETVQLIENTSPDDSQLNIYNSLTGAEDTQSRVKEIIYNIIDLNIMPIKLAALMSSVPLTNLANYAYNMEEYLGSMFDKQASAIRLKSLRHEIAHAESPNNTIEFLIKFLMNPHTEISKSIYGSDLTKLGSSGYVARICRGDNILKMRVKFLSDQIFNKVLIGSIYPGLVYDESGPQSSGPMLRGRQGADDAVLVIPDIDIEQLANALNTIVTPTYLTDMKQNLIIKSEQIPVVNPEGTAQIPQGTIRQYFRDITANIETINNGVMAYHVSVKQVKTQPIIDAMARLRAIYNDHLSSRVGSTRSRLSVLNQGQNVNAFALPYGIQANLPDGDVPFATVMAYCKNILYDHVKEYIDEVMVLIGMVIDEHVSTHDNMIPSGKPGHIIFLDRNPTIPSNVTPIGLAQSDVKSTITYLVDKAEPTDEPWKQITKINVKNSKEGLEEVGKNRFDTFIVRNLMFISLLYKNVLDKINDSTITEYLPLEDPIHMHRSNTEFDINHGVNQNVNIIY